MYTRKKLRLHRQLLDIPGSSKALFPPNCDPHHNPNLHPNPNPINPCPKNKFFSWNWRAIQTFADFIFGELSDSLESIGHTRRSWESIEHTELGEHHEPEEGLSFRIETILSIQMLKKEECCLTLQGNKLNWPGTGEPGVAEKVMLSSTKTFTISWTAWIEPDPGCVQRDCWRKV